MRESFYGFYPPTTEEYELLWKEALVVLDTNVLLNLYRLPTTARDELMTVLESLKDRLWIPYQVALEFHRNRLTVISSERKTIEDVLSSARNLVDEIKEKVDSLQLDKRGLEIDPKILLGELDKANNQLIEAVEAAQNSQLNVSATDAIRDRLDGLLKGRVGVGPATKAELEALIAGGDERYKNKIPPGFMDADKEKNPNEASFIHDHLEYPRKFGDLITWRQLIAHAKTSGIKCVLMVSAERKEDWWWKQYGKIIGPHPELIREIRRDGAVELFWMYSSVQFVEHAKKYTEAKISDQSVTEIKNVTSSSPLSAGDLSGYFSPGTQDEQNDESSKLGTSLHDSQVVGRCVEEWLSRRGLAVQRSPSRFPHFLVRYAGGCHGYQVIRLMSSPAVNLLRVRETIRRRKSDTIEPLSKFTLVLVIPRESEYDTAGFKGVRRLLDQALEERSVDSFVTGTIKNGEFHVVRIEQLGGGMSIEWV